MRSIPHCKESRFLFVDAVIEISDHRCGLPQQAFFNAAASLIIDRTVKKQQMYMEERNRKLAEIFLKAVAAGLGRHEAETVVLSPEEWEELMDLSIEQSLLPLVFEAVYRSMPVDLEQKYRGISLAWIYKQMRDTRIFLDVYRHLTELAIWPMMIKGILCRDTYPFPECRVSSDEDMYIGQAEYMPFHKAMLEMGFKAPDPNFESDHEMCYERRGLRIEGHWKLFPQKSRLWERLDVLTAEIRDRAQFIEIEGNKILMPEPTDHMIYLILHAMKHFALCGVGIRQICDIVQWDRKYTVDWKRVKEVITPLGAASFAAAILDAGNRYFDMRIPEGWMPVDSADLIRDALESGSFGHSTKDRLHSASITSSDGTGHTIIHNLIRTVFPPRKTLEINFPWAARSSLLLPAAWGARIIRYAGNVRKGASPLASVRIGIRRMKLMEKYGVFRTEDEGIRKD